MFTYTKAICRNIPRSIVEEGLRMEKESESIAYDLANKQHSDYVQALESLGVKVTILPADESLPDCVFVEDPVVVIDNTVLITNPGALSRKPETTAMKNYFQEKEQSMIISDMKSPAELDGGDVMFTGHEIFVGLSKRTNNAGVEVLTNTFSKYPVHVIEIENKTLHLKSMMTMGGTDVILCGTSEDACNALKILQEKATRIYSVLRTPEDTGANCVVLNGTMLCRSNSDLPKSFEVLSKLAIRKVELSATELSKVDGCLTCCSVLYN